MDDTGVPLGERCMLAVTGLVSSVAPVNQAYKDSENLVGVAWPIGGAFYSFDTVWSSHLPELNDWDDVPGRIFHLCWMPSKTITTVQLTDIPLGVYDAHIDQMMAGMAAWPNEIVVRWAHEMNGNWYTWSAAHAPPTGCTDPQQYIDAWRYIVNKGRVQCPNVRWFWCASGTDAGAFPMESYYPGSSYVDIIGFDEYNGYGSWKSPFQTFQPAYDRVTALHTTAPVWIGETGCAEDSTPAQGIADRKAQWAADLFAFTHGSRLDAINYFDTVGGRDWRYQTSTSSLAAFAAGFQSVVNANAISERAGVLPLSVESPTAFGAAALPFAGGVNPSAWKDTDGHAEHHSNLSYWLNQVFSHAGTGNVAALLQTDGNFYALNVKGLATGVVGVPLIRVATNVFDATKVALVNRSGGNNADHFKLRMDGQMSWGSGTSAPDTTWERAAAGRLKTNGAIEFTGTATAPSSNPTAGAYLYPLNNSLYMRQPGLGTLNLAKRQWAELYGSGSTINDNPKLATTSVSPPNGLIHLALIQLPETRTIAYVTFDIVTAGSGFTASSNWAGVYDITGVQLGVTADMSTVWNAGGYRQAALTTPVTNLAPQKVLVAILVNATTTPVFRAFAHAGLYGPSGVSQPFVRAGGTGLTTLPSTIDVSALSGATPTAYLCGISS